MFITHRRAIRAATQPSPAAIRYWTLLLWITLPALIGCDLAAVPDMPGSTLQAPAGVPQADAPEAAGAAGFDQIARDIEEADIVKIAGDTLYALNRFKGLLVVDVADPDDPRLVGELDLRGRGVEMFIVGEQAFILLSADFYVFRSDPSFGAPADTAVADGAPAPPPPDFDGSQLAIVDVSDPTAPSLQGKINLVGFANETRRVGDIIYVIGSNFGPFFAVTEDAADDPDAAGEGFVASVNVADPGNIVAVERKNLTGNALMMHVSETAIFAASRSFDFDGSRTLTDIQIVDISDPAGQITLRGAFTVPGSIRNRFYMDAFEGVFRIATESFGFGFQQVRLFTFDLTDLDDVLPLGQTQIVENESLEAVRFDGPRGYVVTFFRVDPLFVIDLTDPAHPTVNGELVVPGFSTHIEPRGDRLIAVGIDDTDGRRPAVAYYDVSDPTQPGELGRVVLGPPGSFTSSEATYDEKAFKIVDELGLIAVPFRHVDDDVVALSADSAANADILPGDSPPPRCMNAVQLVDFSDTALNQRGWFEHDGTVSRVGVLGERVFALSQVNLQTVDISDRDHPVMTGKAEFFDEQERGLFDDCAGFVAPVPIDPPFPPMPPIDLAPLERLLAALDACGALGVMPAMLLVVGLWCARQRTARRRGCR